MRQEVEILSKYPHPFVIKPIDSFSDLDENAYLVIEYAEKLDLRKEM
jgi:serine/threonine protein kinase